jgi:hypothetical protein
MYMILLNRLLWIVVGMSAFAVCFSLWAHSIDNVIVYGTISAYFLVMSVWSEFGLWREK